VTGVTASRQVASSACFVASESASREPVFPSRTFAESLPGGRPQTFSLRSRLRESSKRSFPYHGIASTCSSSRPITVVSA
jgi:hypothetical protein